MIFSYPEDEDSMVEAFLKKSRRYHVEGCTYCARYKKGEMFPPHDASENCESGSHSHCTCDTCF